MISQLKIVFLGILISVGAALAAADSVPVRNCTWCHGTSAQGFTIAPRLAGQRQQYIENQLLSFYRHTRDNPLSQQYMWGAAANLSAQTADELAAYFSTLPAAVRAPAVGAVSVRKSRTQVTLFHVGAVDEKCSYTEEHDEPERAICERGAEEGEDNAGIDGVAHEVIRPARPELMVFSQGLRLTPITPQVRARQKGRSPCRPE